MWTKRSFLVDGIDIREIKRDDIRRQMVSCAGPYLFHGSVFANIAYASPAHAGEVMGSGQSCYAHNFIVNFPDGYDTLVGDAARD
jgi:ABC-type multidrug transport system fused ATPase/permease subunit